MNIFTIFQYSRLGLIWQMGSRIEDYAEWKFYQLMIIFISSNQNMVRWCKWWFYKENPNTGKLENEKLYKVLCNKNWKNKTKHFLESSTIIYVFRNLKFSNIWLEYYWIHRKTNCNIFNTSYVIYFLSLVMYRLNMTIQSSTLNKGFSTKFAFMIFYSFMNL